LAAAKELAKALAPKHLDADIKQTAGLYLPRPPSFYLLFACAEISHIHDVM
jgi:hypothetical protein